MTIKTHSRFIHAPDVYAHCSQAHDSMEAANVALGGFFAEVRELRMKYRIPEISVTVVLNVTQPHTVRTDGEPDTTVPEPSQVIAGFFNGLSTRELRLTAWAFGRAQASHDADVAGMLERARANT